MCPVASDKTQLRPLGGGTKNFYGGPLQGEEVDLRQWAGIVEYEPTELVITVKPGTALAEVEAALAAEKQELAFEPPRLGANGTIGGAIAMASEPGAPSLEELRNSVTSKAGTTAAGLDALNGDGGLSTRLHDTLQAAYDRAVELR